MLGTAHLLCRLCLFCLSLCCLLLASDLAVLPPLVAHARAGTASGAARLCPLALACSVASGRLLALVAPLLVGAWRLLLVVVDPIVVALLVQPLVDVVDQLILGWLVLLVLLAVAVELLVLAVDMHPSAWAQAFRLLVVVAGGVVAVATSVSATLALVEALLGGMATSVSALVEALLLTFWLPSSG